MLKIKEAIVVEGRYDSNILKQLVDAPVFETSGFGIFKNREQMSLLRKVAEVRGLIVLTDSDGAGFVIRNHLKSSIPGKYLKHAYIPEIPGKEKRKHTAGKEGLLGVEGMTPQIIIGALKAAGATIEGECTERGVTISKQDLCELGLSGGSGSAEKRISLQKKIGFPSKMSANALLQALNVLYSPDSLRELVREMEKENG